MNFFKGPKAKAIHPAFNIGCLMDIPTGQYVRGNRGEMVLMGGQGYICSTTGPGNSFKTDLVLHGPMTTLDRQPSVRAIVYDTENSLKYSRFNRIAAAMPRLKHIDFAKQAYDEDPILTFVQKADITGDDFFEHIKDMRDEKVKNARSIKRTLPMRDPGGDLMTVKAAHMLVVDSLSAFGVSSVEDKLVDANALGDSKGNTMFMRDGIAKTQLIMQLPNLTVQGDIYVSMTAHIGMRIEMDAYAPKPISLAFSKSGMVQKGVPDKFQYINDHLMEVYNTKPLLHPTDKSPLYPSQTSDRDKGNDLFIIAGVSSRNKGGQSGVVFPIVVSQTEGIKVALTQYHYLKEVGKKFGIGGNNTTFHLDLVPDINLMRTTVRKLVEETPALTRAVEIESEMLQMRNIWRCEDDLHCTPKELYEDIKAKGYDWDILLNTRGYWMYHEDEAEALPFLSTMDLLMMREGTYHPYWLEDDKKTIKKNHWNIGSWK